MKITSAFVIFSWALFFCFVSTEAGSACKEACTRDLNHVCGTYTGPNGISSQCTFSNRCLFEAHKCMSGEPWIVTEGPCPETTVDCEKICANKLC